MIDGSNIEFKQLKGLPVGDIAYFNCPNCGEELCISRSIYYIVGHKMCSGCNKIIKF